jgi:hydrogenase expression/formation protein HypD
VQECELLLKRLREIVDRPIRIMVACGIQNRVIMQNRLREQLPKELTLVAGPGCSACVVPAGYIDVFVRIAVRPDVITASCKDVLNVPGSQDSLASVAAHGAHIIEIATPLDCLKLAKANPGKIVVYPAVGFEASAPSVAEAILEAAEQGIDNFCVIPSIRLLPPTIDQILRDSCLRIRGLLCSDHLTSISDTRAYTRLAKKYSIACCVTGFELSDILRGLLNMVMQIRRGEASYDNQTAEYFSSEESERIRQMVSGVFFITDTLWRGLGIVAGSGFVIRDELALYDATKRFHIRFSEEDPLRGCACDKIISGRALPPDCPSFGMACTPEDPVGPCMITNEGICWSYFHFSNVVETETE